MSDFQLTTPVVFIIFNRPDTTKRVFEEIRRAKPPKLLVVADGPRPDRPDDTRKCAAARTVIDQVDWDCQVHKNCSDVNLGCGKRVSSGLDWVFEQVEEAIILEDDCLPHPTFFRFCQELLERFREDDRIFMISGRNTLGEWRSDEYSYFFTSGSMWGWATWRRAWQYYDFGLELYSAEWAQRKMREYFKGDSSKIESIQKGCEGVLAGRIDSWDYQWAFIRAVYHGMGVIPTVNLISNIGFGEGATHTSNPNSIYANVKVGVMEFPLRHNNNIYLDFGCYKEVEKLLRGSLPERLKRYLRNWISAHL